MSQNDTPDEFAFGDSQVDDCVCPVYAYQGSPPREYNMVEIAECFDEKAREMTGTRYGVIDQEEAKDVWVQVINEVEDQINFAQSEEEYQDYREMINTVHRMKRKLFN